MKCDTSEPDFTKVGNELFGSFEKHLNNLCKPLTILFVKISPHLHSFWVFLIRWPIFSLESLALISGYILLPSQMSSIEFVLIDPSSDSFSVYDSTIEDKVYLSSSSLHSFSTKLPSSNCAKVIMLQVLSWDDLAYGIYESSGRITSASEYGCDVYANKLRKVSSNKTSWEETIIRVIGTYMRYPFWCCGIPTNITKNFLWMVTHV